MNLTKKTLKKYSLGGLSFLFTNLKLLSLTLFLALGSFTTLVSAQSEETLVGAVYAMTNGADENMVVAYTKFENGSLELLGSYSTGGQGTGSMNVVPGPGAMEIDPLASSYSVVMSEDNRFVFAVNAGSNEVSSFSVNDDYSLSLVSTLSTVDADPVSIASTGNAIYVSCVNGGTGTLRGYSVSDSGELTATSSANLTGRPTAVRFTKDGQYLAVTQVNNNVIHVFPKTSSGLGSPVTYEYATPADGRNVANPFGLETVQRGGEQFLVIGEARVFTALGDLSPQTSSVSTFRVGTGGQLTAVNLDVRTDSDGDDSMGPITTCWVVADASGGTIFSSNTNDNSISNFSIGTDGSASLTQSRAYQDPRTTPGEIVGGLTDIVVVGNTVYQLLAADGGVLVLEIQEDGSLEEVMTLTDLNIMGGNQGITGFDSRTMTPPTDDCVAPDEPTITQLGPTFYQMSWNAVPGAVQYVLQARLSGRDNFAITVTLHSTQAGLYVLPNREFEYRLQSICADGTSEFSPIYSFTSSGNFRSSPSTSRNNPAFEVEIDLIDLEESVLAYPNPFSTQLTIDYQTLENSDATLSIDHITGQKVFEQELSENSFNHTLQLESLQKGSYILSIREGDRAVYNQKLIKQ